jgi:glycosyltransferase involved in cell wall biosynthesis
LKLAIVTSFPDEPTAPHGGVEAVSVNLVAALAKYDDLDITVVTTRRNYTNQTSYKWGKVTIHRLPWAGGSMLGNAIGPGRRQMQKFLWELKPDIIHAHDTYGLLVKGMDLPRVFTIHGFIYGDILVSGSRLAMLRSEIWRYFETGGWADQKHIISISPYVRQRLDGIAKGIIHDIDNPVAEDFFDIKRSEKKGIIFSAALITPRKNILALIDAVAELAFRGLEVTLRLAGSLNDAGYVKQVQSRIKQKGLENKVVLLGRIDSKQVREELAAASVFSLVSLEENSPMGIEEAMAAGVPVVTSNRCGMPYMVAEGQSGFLVNPNDLNEIANQLEQILTNDKLCDAMVAKGREIALERFHPAKVAARTRDVYFQAVKEHKRK